MRSILFPQFVAKPGCERKIVRSDCGGQFSAQPPLFAVIGHRSGRPSRSLARVLRPPVQTVDKRPKLLAKDIVVAGASESPLAAEFQESDPAIGTPNCWVE
jgi:hypothetical protein